MFWSRISSGSMASSQISEVWRVERVEEMIRPQAVARRRPGGKHQHNPVRPDHQLQVVLDSPAVKRDAQNIFLEEENLRFRECGSPRRG